MQPNLKAGLLAGRFFKTVSIADSAIGQEGFLEKQLWNDQHILKAAVSPHTTENASALVPKVGQDFVDMVRPASIVGRLVNARRIPLNTRMIQLTGGPTAFWVSEAGPKPVAAMSFAELDQLPSRKVVGLSVITKELARAANPENMLLRDLAAAAVTALDSAFIDPANSGVAGERPASITYGQATFGSVGSDADAVREDIRQLVRHYRGNLSTAVLLVDSATALAIAMMPAPLGGASMDLANGTGVLFGLPVLISDAVPSDSGGSSMSLIDADGVQIAGVTDAELRTSREATILMDSTPASPTLQAVSLFQTNSIGLMAEIYVNWRRIRADVAVTITDVDYAV